MKKTVIITGAAGGIGSAAAKAFAVKGYAVVLADINQEGLSILHHSLAGEGADVSVCKTDLASEEDWARLIAHTVDRFGRIDVLVNNAAWREPGSVRGLSLPVWEKTLKICLTAPLFLARAAAEVMERGGQGGVIINVSSIMAERPSGIATAYVACKGALNSLTKELAITYGRQGIRVLGIAPGFIDTDLSADYVDPDGRNISKILTGQLTDFIPLGRGGRAEEVAAVIAWACSQEASYLSGTTLTVDGGFEPNFNPYSVKNLQYPDEF